MALTIPVTVDVQMQPQAEAIVSAPVDGIVRANRVPSFLGNECPTRASAGEHFIDAGRRRGCRHARARHQREASDRPRCGSARGCADGISLVEAEAVPQRRLDEARTELRLAEAQISASQARQRRAVAGGGAGVPVVAPISADEVLESSLAAGPRRNQGGEQQLLRIGNPSALWLVARVFPKPCRARSHSPQGSRPYPARRDHFSGARQRFGAGARRRRDHRSCKPAHCRSSLPGTADAVRPGQRVQGQLMPARHRDRCG